MTKRNLPRAPLTEKEFIEGKSYYSEDEVSRILATLPTGSSVELESFRRDLENSADWYVNLAHGQARFAEPPSIAERRWKKHRGALDRALVELRNLPPEAVADLEYAAEGIARRRGNLPDFEPEKIPIEPLPGVPGTEGSAITYWPVEKQLQKSISELDWLSKVAAEAEARAKDAKAQFGGNREDEAKHLFCRGLARILTELCRCPEIAAWTERESDETVGPLADFLEACFEPLEVFDSRAALVRTYRRATKR